MRRGKELCQGWFEDSSPVDYDDIDLKNRSKTKGEREIILKEY